MYRNILLAYDGSPDGCDERECASVEVARHRRAAAAVTFGATRIRFGPLARSNCTFASTFRVATSMAATPDPPPGGTSETDQAPADAGASSLPETPRGRRSTRGDD